MNITENARKILEKRYIPKDENGVLLETVEQCFERIAQAVAAKEIAENPDKGMMAAKDFYDMMVSTQFLPNSPTIMNAGRPLGQLSACFVLPIEDNMESIFDGVKHAALIHKSGGGTGFSFSRLRPTAATVKSTGGVASGPISFMKVYNMATEVVKQGGTRRGANMGILRIDHPDILSFINCKADGGDINNFNLSVGLTEDFMSKVETASNYDLIDPHTKKPCGSLNAKEVFDTIVAAAWRNGEPGIVFLDRINKDNPVPSQGEIEATNPCGEQPLLPYEACNLGSINLAQMLKRTKKEVSIDFDLLRQTVFKAVRFLDDVIEVNNYPLDQIGEMTRSTRKIGLGVMGFADMLIELGIRYGSQEAAEVAESIMEFINDNAHLASQELAADRGPFPLFKESIYKHEKPLRNATLTTIAPTGTLSIIANCSSGVEPIFAYAFKRNQADMDMIDINKALRDKLAKENLLTETIKQRIAEEGTIAHIDEIPQEIRDVFVCAHDITPMDHVRMQAAFQKHLDNAVSKTVNFPSTATRADVAKVYMLAYKEGCKGITIYRDGSRDSQVLSIGTKTAPTAGTTAAEIPVVQPIAPGSTSMVLPGTPYYGKLLPRPRPGVTAGFTEKVAIGCGSLYVTVNYDEHGVCEVITSTGKNGGCPSQSAATSRLVSVALRSGMDIDEIYSQLKGIRCPSTQKKAGVTCLSCPDAIAQVLKKVSTFFAENGTPDKMLAANKVTPKPVVEGAKCPECAEPMEQESGCVVCRSCGFSKCG